MSCDWGRGARSRGNGVSRMDLRSSLSLCEACGPPLDAGLERWPSRCELDDAGAQQLSADIGRSTLRCREPVPLGVLRILCVLPRKAGEVCGVRCAQVSLLWLARPLVLGCGRPELFLIAWVTLLSTEDRHGDS